MYQFLLQMFQKKCNEYGYDILKEFVVNYLIQGKCGASKIRLLQCNVALWIHIIDVICTFILSKGKVWEK